MTPDARCGTCRFWLEKDGAPPRAGECRRYPPVDLEMEHAFKSFWPDSYASDWCGEWQAKPEAAE